jgi:hypothetical protein
VAQTTRGLFEDFEDGEGAFEGVGGRLHRWGC